MAKGTRLDVFLVEQGYFPSRAIAQTAIMDGAVLVNNQKATKSGALVNGDCIIEILDRGFLNKYVSRGGLKLEKAIIEFNIDVQDRICLDIGASTGGFTDCLLQNSAKQVYAVDVGYGQLAWKLREDPRVIVKERINARHLTADTLYEEKQLMASLMVVDASFISLLTLLPNCLKLVCNDALLACLIKPQFEVGKDALGKGGVVRSSTQHIAILNTVLTKAAELGLRLKGLTYSPVKGPAGNIEFLALWQKGMGNEAIDEALIESTVIGAHESLNQEASS
jgi:23S rRNA (cytidine1920-2'-O)/16S rRNA (cytidine1409-2'-O)-methyltransferase